MIAVVSEGRMVAKIFKSTQSDVGHRAAEPWLLKRPTGRVDRFRTMGDAKAEAQKSWVGVGFHKTMIK